LIRGVGKIGVVVLFFAAGVSFNRIAPTIQRKLGRADSLSGTDTIGRLGACRRKTETLWLRGGFPDSLLAEDDGRSVKWRQDFIRTYLERDIPQLGPRIPAETLRRFWSMLAHNQGELLNAAKLAAALGVDGKTVARYLDLLVDLLLVRRLKPWHSNAGKRLVKSPKTYVRDSGLAHALLGIADKEALLGHPVCGRSWEGFVIENCLAVAPLHTEANFYRSSSGAECDLVLTFADQTTWAIEIKRSQAPSLQKGFYFAKEDILPSASFLIYPGTESYPVAEGVRAIGLNAMLDEAANAEKRPLTNSTKM
jgi:uncharacterized protein